MRVNLPIPTVTSAGGVLRLPTCREYVVIQRGRAVVNRWERNKKIFRSRHDLKTVSPTPSATQIRSLIQQTIRVLSEALLASYLSRTAMMGIEEAMEIIRGVPIPYWLFLPAVFLSFGLGPVPVAALHEFTAHRMQHFDLHGVRYGKWRIC